MQTFMPYSNFLESVSCLDRKRLGKQRVETKQILLALGVPVGEHKPMKSSWSSHPATRMWKGYEGALCVYGWMACNEWKDRGYKDTLGSQFLKASTGRSIKPPPWMGDEGFHASHRSNLLRKLPEHYASFGWSEPNDLPYVWPVKKEVELACQ